MNRLIIILTSLVLAACSSSPIPPVNYYVLDKAPTTAAATPSEQASVVVLESIQLADYLNQSNMAMQLDDHQMFYSRQHLWAESLHKSIRRALLSDLNQSTDSVHFAGADTPLVAKADWRLRLDVDHFVATDDASVLIAGTYWLTDQQGEYVLHKTFRHVEPLQQDGFGHSVAQLRTVLRNLANDIGGNVGALPR